ncbi:MAG: hypothetical protein ABSC22_07200 [Roseiarcus sp.]|jgi:hypothetical protein
MRASVKTSIAVSLAALTLVAGLAASATPAAAKPWWPHHHGWGPGLGIGIGLGVLGAAAASQYGSGDDYDSCIRYRRTYDAWGNYIGREPVNVCN